MKKLEFSRLGLLDYRAAQALQAGLVAERKLGQREDLLLLLSHPDVITLGRPESRRFLKSPQEDLAVPVVVAGRGGEVTFHGPGQLIAYPILALDEPERDLHRYLRQLEEVGLRICAHLGLSASRVEGRTGVWIGQRKVAAIGVRARSWITFHGIAINRTPELQGFDLIVPCGIADAGVTSLEGELGRTLPEAELQDLFLRFFAEVFQRVLVEITLETESD